MPAPINMFGGLPLNRLSWLRPNHAFMNALIASPTALWILFKSGEPLVIRDPTSDSESLAFLKTRDVKSLLGPEPHYGQGPEQGQHLSAEHAAPRTEAARLHHSPIVFLGLHEKTFGQCAITSEEVAVEDKAKEAVLKLEGTATAYFSIDVVDLGLTAEELQEVLKKSEVARENSGMEMDWVEPRLLMMGLDPFIGGIFASARSMVDWNTRNKYCAACGSKLYSLWAGWKLACSSLLPWNIQNIRTGEKLCPTARGLHNFMHPRTDAVVIMIAIDETGDKILLGRGKKYPGKFYSALAGFIEPGESFEDAVARECWEEAGVKVWDVRYHSTQAWPYPANLMVGFYARADASKPLRIDLDNELIDAQWFTREQIKEVLNNPTGTKFGRDMYKKMSEGTEGRDNTTHSTQATAEIKFETSNPPPFRVPPTTSIAGLLIREWMEKRINFNEVAGL